MPGIYVMLFVRLDCNKQDGVKYYKLGQSRL